MARRPTVRDFMFENAAFDDDDDDETDVLYRIRLEGHFVIIILGAEA